MIIRSVALAAALAASSLGAQAALTSFAPWDAAFAGNGLAGVQFDVNSANGVTLALGAHAYKHGVNLPNDGVRNFYAQPGTYPGEPNRANWSFDFAVTMATSANCTGCTVSLFVDTDPSGLMNLVRLFQLPVGNGADSWNMEMDFGTPGGFALLPGNLLQSTYDFDPNGPSSTAFSLVLSDSNGRALTSSDITVNVPEPGSLALVGLGLGGLALLRRRSNQRAD